MTRTDSSADFTMLVSEAADELEVSRGYIRRMIAEGRLESIKRGKFNFLRPADIEALRDRPDMRRRDATPPTKEIVRMVDSQALATMQRVWDQNRPVIAQALNAYEQVRARTDFDLMARVAASVPQPDTEQVAALTIALRPTVEMTERMREYILDLPVPAEALETLSAALTPLRDVSTLLDPEPWDPIRGLPLDDAMAAVEEDRQWLDRVHLQPARPYWEYTRAEEKGITVNVLSGGQAAFLTVGDDNRHVTLTVNQTISDGPAARALIDAVDDLVAAVGDALDLHDSRYQELRDYLSALRDEAPKLRKAPLRALFSMAGAGIMSAIGEAAVQQVNHDRIEGTIDTLGSLISALPS